MKKWFCALGMMLALLISVALAGRRESYLCRKKRANQRRL